MSIVTANEVVSKAKSLVGVDTDHGKCDIMKWYGYFSTEINNVACCCAGMMYLFSKLNALEMIPGGLTANCGQLAVNFYKADQLYKPSEVRVGDIVLFSWSGSKTSMSPLNNLGYKTFDHAEVVIEVNSSTIRTVGANNGGTECDDFQYKTRNRSNISACCRPKYKTSSSSSTSSTLTPNAGNSAIKSVQTWVNKNYKTGLKVDGIYGSLTKKALVKALQTELNKQYKAGLVVDGIYGAKTNSAVRNLSYGAKGNLTKTLQGLLICNGYSTNGFDGVFGNGTKSAVKSYQSKKKLTSDGIAGQKTFSALCK